MRSVLAAEHATQSGKEDLVLFRSARVHPERALAEPERSHGPDDGTLPEQTTEEFLHEISERPSFPEMHSQKLQEFLESADLVKFAGHQPQKDDVNASIQRARAFIGISWTPEQAA